MDPVTHSLTGAAIAAAASRRRIALAAPAAILAANIPDIDVLSYFNGEYAALAFRRGVTHGPSALPILAFVTVVIMLGWDRMVRRKREPSAAPAEPLPLLAICGVAVLTHPLLDYLNTYGIRWLMPFDRRWYYGDSLFIIDPWLWLLLGVPLFLVHSQHRRALVGWAAFAALASVLVLATGMVPVGARLFWIGALLAAATARATRSSAAWQHAAQPLTLGGLGLAASYIAAMVAADVAATRHVAVHAAEYGIVPRQVMVAPLPAQPLRSSVVISDGQLYWFGRHSWRARPRVALQPRPVARGELDEVATAAAAVPEARDFLVWSRFPIVESRPEADGYIVRFSDARYLEGRAGSLGGVTIRLDSALAPRTDEETW